MDVKRWVSSLFTKIRDNKLFYKYGNLNPAWLNLGKNNTLLNAYYEIPELNAVINYGAESISNGIWKYQNEKGENEDHSSLKLLNNPNPVQNGKELLKDFYVYKAVFGNDFIYKLYPDGRKPTFDNIKCLYNIPAQEMSVKMTGKLFQQTELNEIIEGYLFGGRDGHKFETEDILLSNDIGIKYKNGQYILGQSRMIGLSKALSNIIAAYESRNVLLNSRGAIGAWVNASKDATGATWALRSEEKKEIRDQATRNYGLTNGKSAIMVTNKDIRWEGNTFDSRRLQLMEETEQDFYKICDAYATPKELFSNTKGTTFTNKDSAERSFYRNRIIPVAEDLANGLTKFLVIEKGKLILDFSHLEILQEDEKVKAERNSKNSQTILSIQKSVKEGNTSEDSGIQILMYLFNMSEDQAKLILGKNGIITD